MSKNVPKLRFKKRDGDDYPEWESKKISEIFTFYSTNSLSRDKLTGEETEMKNIHYGDIHTKFGSILDVNKMVLPSIKEESIASLKNYTVAIDGDIFIADASEDYADIGKATEINNVDDARIVGGLHVLHLRDEKDFYVNGIKGFLFNSPNIRDQIKIVAVGSKVLGLSKPGLGGLDISIMHKEEQLKIANFLSAIDSRIANQSSKLDAIQELKKGVMQKIFSQEIRFKREDGGEYPDWEEKTLLDVAELINGRAYAQNELLSKGKVPVLRVGNFFTNNEWYYSDLDLDENKYAKNGDLLYAWSATFGPRLWKGEKVIYHYHIWKVIVKEFVQKNFLYHWFVYDVERIKEVQTGGTMHHITKGNMEKRQLNIPSLEEQQKIADFLSTLDTKISIETQILSTLQTLKKGLLQQMFV